MGYGAGAGVDSASEQKKLEARKCSKMPHEAFSWSAACFVGHILQEESNFHRQYHFSIAESYLRFFLYRVYLD